MTTEQLRDKYEQETGTRCINSKGDGYIGYVEWLEERPQFDFKPFILGVVLAFITAYIAVN